MKHAFFFFFFSCSSIFLRCHQNPPATSNQRSHCGAADVTTEETCCSVLRVDDLFPQACVVRLVRGSSLVVTKHAWDVAVHHVFLDFWG